MRKKEFFRFAKLDFPDEVPADYLSRWFARKRNQRRLRRAAAMNKRWKADR